MMTYQQHVVEIRQALLDAIASCEDKIREIGTHPIGCSPINGIAVEIIPFHQSFSIHFRDDSDERSVAFPEWKHWGLYEGSDENAGLLKRLEQEYDASDDGEAYMLKLNTAVADALLCEEIVSLLKSYAMAEYFQLDRLGNSGFEFVVLDLDDCVQANFCDIIRWKRNIPEEVLHSH